MIQHTTYTYVQQYRDLQVYCISFATFNSHEILKDKPKSDLIQGIETLTIDNTLS